MISSEIFLARVEEIAAEEPGYEKGHWGQDGMCDCIGLIIGAIRRAGGQWRGLHGSNWAARNEMLTLKPITGTADLKPGEVVYKSYEAGQGGNKLPDRYLPGGSAYNGDLRDYYHVGVVISVYPLRIRHMTTPRPKMDTSITKWQWHGELKKVRAGEPGGEEDKMGKAVIAGGDVSLPINMREAASTGSRIIAEIPQGSEVELIEAGGSWNRVKWNGKTGYVMSIFVNRDTSGKDGETISVNRKELEKAYDILGDLLGLRG